MKKLLTSIALLSTILIANAQSTIPQGGTGWATSTTGDLLVGTTSKLRYTRLPIGTTGQVLWVTGGTPRWVATSSLGISGGSATPAGLNQSVQFNDLGVFGGGGADFSWDKTALRLFTTNASSTNLTSLVSIYIKGLLFDSTNASGTSNQVLISTGTSTLWVSTSTLGFGGGGSGSGNSAWTIGNGVIYNATSSDKVGIGTSTPVYKLDLQDNGSAKGIQLSATSSVSPFLTFKGTAGRSSIRQTSTRLELGTGDPDSFSPMLALLANGFSGFNSSAPLSFVSVGGNGAFGTAYSQTFAAPTNGLIVEGRTGVGTATPVTQFSVVGSQSLSGGFLDSTYATGTIGQYLLSTGTSTLWTTVASSGVTNAYASSTFPSFTYATATFPTFTYGSSTYGTYTYGTSTWVSLFGNQTIAGNKTFTGTTTLATTTISLASTTLAISSPVIYSSGNAYLTLASTTGISASLGASLANLFVTTNASTSRLTSTGFRVVGDASVTGTSTINNASTTNLSASTGATIGALNVTGNASTTNLTSTGLRVVGAFSVTGVASTTAFSASTGATLANLSVLTLASTTALSSTGFSGANGYFTGTFGVTGQTTLGNATTTSISASTGATLANLFVITNASTSKLSATTLSTGNTGVNGTLNVTSTSTLSTTTLQRALLDSVNLTGTSGQALTSTGSSTLWSTIISFLYASTTFPSFTYATSTFVNYTYASSTRPNFTYATSTFPSFTYATSTYAPINGSANYVTYVYATTTFPNFTYATTTFPSFTYATSTYGTYTYGTSTWVSLFNNQTIAGNKTFTGTTTLATTTMTVGSSTIGFSSPSLYFTNAWGTTASTTNLSVSTDAYFGGNTGKWNNSGNLGVGTTSPASRFHVEGANPIFTMSDTAQVPASGFFNWYNTGAVLTLSQGVIGTSADARLAISSTQTTSRGLGIQSASAGAFTGTNVISFPSSGSSFINNSGNFGIGTTTPWNTITVATGSIVGSQYDWGTSTSTSMTVDWTKANSQKMQMSTSAYTITFLNGTTSPGATLRLFICSPANNTQGAVTFTHVGWPGGTQPTQTTTAKKCDQWSFVSTMSSSTNIIIGNASVNF